PGPAPYAVALNTGPACAGGSVTLIAYGSGTVYSWTGPGGFTSTQQNPTGITVPGVYGVMLTDTGPCGGTTWVFTTVVIDSALAITRQPAGQIVSPGSKATFTVAASGGDLHYQWFVRHPSNVTNPVGTDSPSFTTYPEGNAVWFVRITNACGTLDSVEAGAQVGTTRHHASH
ncbi:MAG TPA: hypothetical protein VNN08_14965, partial [Thermoanaerobaculia bacterium]|nr:hypothetical protein [Thermoanaerobaculia bacterium]